MSFLNKIKGLGRKDSADLDTLEQDRFDEPSGRDDMPLPGAGGTVALDVGAMQATAQMDSSIITEAAPSELAELAEARSAEGPQTQSADSGALPVIGARPVGEQQRILGGLVLLGVIGVIATTIFALNAASKGSAQVGATGQALMQSQRLAKSVSQALVGSPQAFPEVRESTEVLARTVRELKTGEGALAAAPSGVQELLDPLLPLVDRAEKNANTVVSQQKILTQVGQALRTINRQSSDLLEIAETISSLKLQQDASPAELSAVGQLVMLTQRIGKSANEFLTMEGVSPEAVFLLGKDLNSFREIAQGLSDGNHELRLPATKDPQTKERLVALLKQYEETRTQASAILGNLQGLVSAREAQASIIADSEPLRHAFHRQEFVGRFADALGQHHQLASRRDLGGWRVLLQLERRHGFGNFQQVGRLTVDGSQSVTHLRQDFLLTHDHGSIALGTFHQRRDGIQLWLVGLAEGFNPQLGIPTVEGAHVARQHAGALHHVRERLRASHQCLRHRFGQSLGLHQGLARGRELLCGAVCLLQHPARNDCQNHHTQSQQHQQATLMRRCGGLPQNRQRNEFGVGVGRRQFTDRSVRIALHTVECVGLIGPELFGRKQVLIRSGTSIRLRRVRLAVEQISNFVDNRHGAASQKNSSTDAQKSVVLRQGLQIQLLPAMTFGVDIGRTKKRGRVFGWWLRGHECVGSAKACQTIHQQCGIDLQHGVECQQVGLGERLLGAHRRLPHQARQIDHTGESTAQVGHTHEPLLGIGHGLHHGPRKNLSRMPQGQKVFATGSLHGQPGRNRQALGTRRL